MTKQEEKEKEEAQETVDDKGKDGGWIYRRGEWMKRLPWDRGGVSDKSRRKKNGRGKQEEEEEGEDKEEAREAVG